jgi:hypothetical protein
MMVVIIHLSLPGRARMLLLQQSSSGRCLNHQLQRGGKPMGSYVSFSNVSQCSRLKAPHLDDVDLSLTSPHHQQHTRRKPRSTRNNRKRGISPNLSTPALATTMTHTMSSTRSKGTRMVLAVVTTLDVAAATIAGRTGAHRLNP